jgi:primosomal protein N' (replication factor Y)
MIESTAESHFERFSFANSIVVATPGAEPIAESGYSGVVILDAGLQLNRDSLRSTEDALRIWLNALAFGRENAIRFISGIDGPIAELIKSNSFREIALREFAHRKELRLPPAVRICSVSASVDLLAKIMDLLSNEPVEILGPVKMKTNQFEPESRLILKFEYSDGAHLANKLQEISLSLSAGQSRFSSKSGRAMRPIRIKMDDPEVI